MAVLYINEFRGLPPCQKGDALATQAQPLASQTVAISGTSASSAPFNPDTSWVDISTDTTCSIAFNQGNASGFGQTAVNATATTSNMRLAANERKLFYVKVGPFGFPGYNNQNADNNGVAPQVLAVGVIANT